MPSNIEFELIILHEAIELLEKISKYFEDIYNLY